MKIGAQNHPGRVQAKIWHPGSPGGCPLSYLNKTAKVRLPRKECWPKFYTPTSQTQQYLFLLYHFLVFRSNTIFGVSSFLSETDF